MEQVKGKVAYMSQVAHQAEAHPGFRGMKRLTRNISTPPPGWDASP